MIFYQYLKDNNVNVSGRSSRQLGKGGIDMTESMTAGWGAV